VSDRDIASYHFEVNWSEEDQLFIAKVTEYPSLAAHGNSPEQALTRLKGVVHFVVKELKEEGASIPRPFHENTSGKTVDS